MRSAQWARTQQPQNIHTSDLKTILHAKRANLYQLAHGRVSERLQPHGLTENGQWVPKI